MAIRTIDRSEALDSIWDDLIYTETRLLGQADAQDLAPVFSSLLERLEKARTAQRSCWRAEIVAQVKVDEADDALDELVQSVSRELLYLSNHDRSGPRFKRYFSQAPSAIIRQGLQTEVETVRSWGTSLPSEQEPALKALGEQLNELLPRADTALKERTEAAARRADQRVREIDALVDDVNGARRSVYGVLVQRAEEKNKPKDWPNRFFARGTRPTRPAAPQDT